MALVIEDGTGKANSNSYATAAALVAYALARGVTLTEAAAEPLLIEAMERLAGLDYIGCRYTRDQALDWPRSGVCIDGFSYAATEIPPLLVQAQLALAFAANSLDLMPTAAAGADARGAMIEKTVGPITTRWSDRAPRTRASVPIADAYLAKLLTGRGGGLKVLRA